MSEIMLQAMEKLQRERDEAQTQEKWHFDNYVFAQEECLKLREQRDALAVALEMAYCEMRHRADCNSQTAEKCTCGLVDTAAVVREAIASVKAEEPEDPHKYCRGGGGNNFHCGCKYA